jgi:transposase
VFADQGFAGRLVAWAARTLKMTVEIVRKPAEQRGFVCIRNGERAPAPPWKPHWVVERSLAWLTAHRRLARDYERDPEISEEMIRWAAINQMLRGLARAAEHDLREIFNAISLHQPHRHRLALHAPRPAALADGLPVRATSRSPRKASTPARESWGRKRGIITDTPGLLLAVIVTAASVSDDTIGMTLLDRATDTYPTLTKARVDAGFRITYKARESGPFRTSSAGPFSYRQGLYRNLRPKKLLYVQESASAGAPSER